MNATKKQKKRKKISSLPMASVMQQDTLKEEELERFVCVLEVLQINTSLVWHVNANNSTICEHRSFYFFALQYTREVQRIRI
jgi:hypothetical protein